MLKKLLFLIITLVSFYANGQTNSFIEVRLNDEEKLLTITQKMEYFNSSKDSLTEIQLVDWANAFSSKTTPLAKRFNEDYRRAFHFSAANERGGTDIYDLKSNNKPLKWNRLKNHPDIVSIALEKPLAPNDSITFNIKYNVKIADKKFTNYGYGNNDSYKLRYWHLAPALYTDKWVSQSHLNLNDFTADYCNYTITLKTSDKKEIESNIDIKKITNEKSNYTYSLAGNYVSNIILYLDSKKLKFTTTKIQETKVVSDIPFDGIKKDSADAALKKVFHFVTDYYGVPSQEKLVLDYSEYKKQPVYGFNQLPKFLRPFSKSFQYEIISLKQMTRALGKQNFKTNLRTEQWITDALQVYVLMKYVDTYYPDSKLAGRLHKVFGIRWFHGTQIPFNEQYYIGAKNMAARFLQQKITTPKDSLLKFNYNLSNPYTAGMGLNYLESYTNNENYIKSSFQELTATKHLRYLEGKDLLNILKKNTNENIDWFTNDFLNGNKIIDVKIKKLERTKDSIKITLKNNGKALPIALTGLKGKKSVSSKWTPVFTDTTSLTFEKSAFDEFIIDNNKLLPEVNRRNNYHKVKGLLNKKLQIRLLQDIENPKYHQIFAIPDWSVNVYDGLLVGSTFNNKSFIRKNLFLSIAPKYGTRSKKLLGSANASYTHQFKESGWYLLRGSIGARTSSFSDDLLFRSFTPTLSLSFRPKDLRSNLNQSISVRYTSIQRDESPNVELPTPNYNVLTAKYTHNNSYFDKGIGYGVEFRQSKDFNKLIATFNYRKLFLNNQQINLRLYAGTFLKNNTIEDNQDFFSFGLDKPTDYLFQYGFLTRDDDGSLASQQFITSEGNFKSRLNTRFANEWITTATLETSIWKWINAYVDAGWLKNEGSSAIFQYDTGIKLNLAQDYFELFFPLQSSIGFEPNLDNYEKRIRFKVSLSFTTLTKLFTRQWY